MNDKELMEGLLLTTKGVADLYLHGTIESSTSHVHSSFDHALCETLKMQNQIYDAMSQQGWYKTEQAQMNEIQKVKQKFTKQN
ncbi:MAG: spore coat protein [Erysipelotrichaceae bacterium]|nr:spore coat protein [Erysipelotrichaceae bacterium]